jgi:hypothetical protein
MDAVRVTPDVRRNLIRACCLLPTDRKRWSAKLNTGVDFGHWQLNHQSADGNDVPGEKEQPASR